MKEVEGKKVDEQELKDLVLGKLARYKTLERGVRFVDSIPKNASGMILKRILRDWAKKEKNRVALKL
jgi:4-coumarate--CoA ligase